MLCFALGLVLGAARKLDQRPMLGARWQDVIECTVTVIREDSHLLLLAGLSRRTDPERLLFPLPSAECFSFLKRHFTWSCLLPELGQRRAPLFIEANQDHLVFILE